MAQVKIPPISRMDSVELSLFEALQLSPGGLRELEQSSDSELSEPSETENIISKLQREREQHMAQIAHSFNVSTPAGFVLEADTEALKEFESEQKTSDGAVSEQWINRYFTRANESDLSVFITNGSCNDPANPLILIVVAKEYDPNDSKRLSKVRAIISTMEVSHYSSNPIILSDFVLSIFVSDLDRQILFQFMNCASRTRKSYLIYLS